MSRRSLLTPLLLIIVVAFGSLGLAFATDSHPSLGLDLQGGFSVVQEEIVEHARRTNARVSGPVPLPTRIERYTVLRSPHVDKKSREQFELRTHKRLIDIHEANARTAEVLNRLVVPAGVFVKIKA